MKSNTLQETVLKKTQLISRFLSSVNKENSSLIVTNQKEQCKKKKKSKNKKKKKETKIHFSKQFVIFTNSCRVVEKNNFNKPTKKKVSRKQTCMIGL